MEVGHEYDDRFGETAARRAISLFEEFRRSHKSDDAIICDLYDQLIFFAAEVLAIEAKRENAPNST